MDTPPDPEKVADMDLKQDIVISGYETADEWKEKGNVLFKENDLLGALSAYEQGVQLLGPKPVFNSQNGHQLLRAQTELALRSNVGLVLYKLERYDKAIDECDKALQLDPTCLKVLFRRALAREKITPPDLAGAVSDLKLYIEHKKFSKEALQSLKRIEKKLEEQTSVSPEKNNSVESLSSSHRQTEVDILRATTSCNGKNEVNNSDTFYDTVGEYPVHFSPFSAPDYQRNEVLKLLAQSSTPRNGESYFIISTTWWEQWCRYTNIMESSSEKIEHWQQLIYSCSSITPRKKKIHSHSPIDSDLESLSSSDSSCNAEYAPGIIDNTEILNPFRHLNPPFYRRSKCYTLRPYLLMGYHFEVVPREVYAAFRSWYGEKTPSIYRRTTLVNGKIKLCLYPQNQFLSPENKVPNMKICYTCHSPASFSCSRCSSVNYCSQECQTSHWPFHKQYCSQNGHLQKRNKSAMQKAKWRRCGLNNLGNTCFLNSALQCLSHVNDLTIYFLTNQYLNDLNPHNPLGAGGGLAKSFDKVLKDVYFGSLNSVSPTSLKRAIAVYAPRFAGCHQHDAQEFLAYLLDGLHEDLNRVKEKKYVEMPDVDGNRMDMKIAGAEAWDAYRRRNDSLVMDTFYGQFKSTCVCPKCEKVSVAFDSFNHVSLEMPQYRPTTQVIPVIVFRSHQSISNGNQLPIRYGVVVSKQGSVIDIKIQLERLCGIPRKQLALIDVYESTVYDIIEDTTPISKIRPNDVLVAYEVNAHAERSIHMIATHLTPVSIPQNYSNHHVDQIYDEDITKQKFSYEKFGFPLLANFDSTLSCEKLWEYLWNQVSCFVLDDDDKQSIDSIERVKGMLNIRVVDQHGNPRQVFSDSLSCGSLLPRNSSTPILDFLGNDSLENFLFLSYEWMTSNATAVTKQSFDKTRFDTVYNHSTFIQRKFRSNNITLNQCFSTFTQPERLDENNKWYCSSCQQHVQAMKTMQLWKLPNVLVIHLKRFDHKHARTKLESFVDFPLENLDLSELCTGGPPSANEGSEKADPFVLDDIPANYDLFAVINHYGKMGFGHYTAYARQWDNLGRMDSSWNLFDDSSVGRVERDTIVSPAAYVLFYKRVPVKG